MQLKDKIWVHTGYVGPRVQPSVVSSNVYYQYKGHEKIAGLPSNKYDHLVLLLTPFFNRPMEIAGNTATKEFNQGSNCESLG